MPAPRKTEQQLARRQVLGVSMATVTLWALEARADPTPEPEGDAAPDGEPATEPDAEPDPDADPAEDAAEPPAKIDRSVAERYGKPTPGSDIDSGGALIGVNAPFETVAAVCRSYRKYNRILPRVKESHIIGKKKGATDVYMSAPILGGIASISFISRFTEHPYGPAGLRIGSEFVSGKVKDFRGSWFISPCGPNRTIVRVELFIDINFPVPSSLVSPELMWAAGKGVTAVRDIAECGASTVKGD